MARAQNNSLDIGKIPPQAIDFEKAVLGALMLEKDAIIEVINIISKESFYQEHHIYVFEAISQLFDQNKAIDLMTVSEQLRRNEKLEEIGGFAYLSGLTMIVASAVHIIDHAKVIQQKYLQRELIRVSTETQRKAFDDSCDVKDTFDFIQESIIKLQAGNIKKEGRTIGTIGQDRLNQLTEIQKGNLKTIGVPAWDRLNAITGGWQPGNLIIIAARPSMGKTRLAEEIAKIASSNNHPVAFFSLEMSDIELYDRSLSSATGIENMFIRQAKFNKDDWNNIELAQGVIEKRKIIIDDQPSLTVLDFRARAMLYKKKYGIELIIIDYLQLMRNPEYKFNREQEVSSISSTLKSVAKQLNVPIIALSQLSRKVEDRTDKTPQLSDLRESGAIEQDADLVAFIHRPEYYQKDNDEVKNLIIFILAKHRNGALMDLKLFKSDRWSTIYEDKDKYYTDHDTGNVTDYSLPTGKQEGLPF